MSTRWLRVLLVAVASLLLAAGSGFEASASRSIRQSGEPTTTSTERATAPITGDRSIRESDGSGQASYQLPAAMPYAPAPSDTENVETCRDSEEWAMLALINQYREANGLSELQMAQTLSDAAEFHSVDMATRNYFDHTLSNGLSWSENMTAFGYGFETYRAENIAAGNATALETFHQWVNSPGHNANLLSPNVAAIGIGRAYSGTSDFGFYWTATFGGVADSGAC